MPESTDVVRAFYDAINQKDGAALDALCSPDVEVHALTGSVTGRVYRLGELGDYLADAEEAWERMLQTPADIEQLDDGRVLAAIRFQARARLSGVETDQLLGVIFGLRDGKIASMHAYSSVREAREALEE